MEDGYYWVRFREGDDWLVVECRYGGLDFYFTDSEKKFSSSDFYEIDERRIEREAQFPVGTVVEMTQIRGGHGFGIVTEVDLTNQLFQYKIWYGPDPDDWVRLSPDEFSIPEKRV